MPAASSIRSLRLTAEDQARLDRAQLADLPGLVMMLNRSGRYPMPLDAVAITAMRMRTQGRAMGLDVKNHNGTASSARSPGSSEKHTRTR